MRFASLDDDSDREARSRPDLIAMIMAVHPPLNLPPLLVSSVVDQSAALVEVQGDVAADIEAVLRR